jgi:hypothetical protein
VEFEFALESRSRAIDGIFSQGQIYLRTMTDLTKLKVSLTKHGAHKLAILFRYFDSTNILDNLWDQVPGVKIFSSQAIKNLSAHGNVVPDLWDEAKTCGFDTIDALVLIAIIFSHHKLIAAMAQSSDKRTPFCGTIERDVHLEDKAFTNFAHTLEELGFTTEHSDSSVSYDLSNMFEIDGLNDLAIKLLTMKLRAASWDESNSVIDELQSHNFHKVFSITADQFRNWLLFCSVGGQRNALDLDLSFFKQVSDALAEAPFVFKSGHNPKKTGKVGVARSKRGTTADLLHNAMQTKLFTTLVQKYGPENVGTEVPTGADTSIDIVVKTKDFCWFYEIKTADTVKGCIRQGIPQLLEYAYWHGATDRADRLIIVGPAPITAEAARYLDLLRETFGLPIEYEELPVK